MVRHSFTRHSFKLGQIRWWLLAVALLAVGKAGWIDAKALVAQELLKHAWEQTVNSHAQDRSVDHSQGPVASQSAHKPAYRQVHKPWPWFDSQPVAELVWPNGDQQILLAGWSGQAMAFAPGLELMDAKANSLAVDHWQQADTIMAGAHNDTHFTELENVDIGATFTLVFASGEQQHYRVASKQVRDSRDQDLLPAALTGGMQGQLMLITCYPFKGLSAGGPLRYVVTANPV